MTMRIYMDYNASSPIAPEVRDAMLPYLETAFGNPSSRHWAGRPARDALDRAREQVASLLGCAAEEIIFTSGGTESNNLAIKGAYFAHMRQANRADWRGRLICTAVEHPAVGRPMRFLELVGARVTVLPVDETGRARPQDLEAALTPDTVLVSVMHANNEVGTIQPVAEMAAVCRSRGILFHCDAAQSLGKIPARVDELGVDMLSIAGHKLHAPKGVGALYVRRGVELEPLLHGAGHERGIRSGTENVILAVGLGKACELAASKLSGSSQVRELRDYFEAELARRFGDGVAFNGHRTERLPNTASVDFVGRVGGEVLGALEGVAASTGAACHSGLVELSDVLAAMGVSETVGMGAIRFSFGHETTRAEVDHVLEALGRALA